MTDQIPPHGQSVICEFHVGDELHKGAARNLSTSGFFVATDAVVDAPTELDVRLTGPGSREPVYLKTIVARRQGRGEIAPGQARGLQLRVLELSPEYGRLLGAATGRSVARDPLLSERSRRAAAEHEWLAGITEQAPRAPASSRNAEVDRSRWEEREDVFERAGEALWSDSPASPAVLIIDDGELDDIDAMARALGADTRRVDLGTDTVFRNWSPPTRLLVVTAERALSLRLPLVARRDDFVAVVVTTSDARTIPAMMHRLGYRYVVRRPVHPEALRSLVRRALHDDRERRRAGRATMGCPVRWRRGLRSRRGTLIDLSVDGCQLLVREPVTLGSRLQIRIPREVAGRRGLVVKGSVIRRNTLPGDRRLLGIHFDDATIALRDRIERAVDALADGPFRLEADVPEDPEDRRAAGPDAGGPKAWSPEQGDRRRKPRVALRRQLVALDVARDEVRHALMGRDLAMNGVRIEPNPALHLDEQLRLAFYDSDAGDPLILHAVVARDDGALGMWLRFVGVEDAARARLRKALDSLPSLESVADEEPEAAWAMLGQVALEKIPGPAE